MASALLKCNVGDVASARKVERGDPSVSLGTYATALYVLGMVDRLADFADVVNDPVGLGLEEERLPERIHL